MPVFLDSHPGRPTADSSSLCIGLINNMGDEALKATERQFVTLLTAASPDLQVRLSFFSLPGIPRTPALTSHIQRLYCGFNDLWRGSLDGIIVSGREPLAPRLEQENWWPAFTDLVEWARSGVYSSIWSCLAAHSAVLSLDGVERVRYNSKLCGVFPCAQTMQHPLLQGMSPILQVPHSRWNTLEESSLRKIGYQVLTRGAEAGVDTFVKQEEGLMVFLQGHPEYEHDTLAREYLASRSLF
jgi:homoserine O-succinyltransferase